MRRINHYDLAFDRKQVVPELSLTLSGSTVFLMK